MTVDGAVYIGCISDLESTCPVIPSNENRETKGVINEIERVVPCLNLLTEGVMI
jgi:hypothetical protein